MTKPKISKKSQKKIAVTRINYLFEEAQEQAPKDQTLANRYIFLARKIAMKLRLRFTTSQKRQFCKHCFNFLRPGHNSRVRTSRGKVVIFCLSCEHHMRIPYLREKKERRMMRKKEQ
tara:strand:- start:1255 stop:1605 length:351 start_codon:yes stop_codon:yes gene_type:complete